MSGDLQLGGRRALVTGGTKGVGEAVVARLRECGVKVRVASDDFRAECHRCASAFTRAIRDAETAR